MYYQINILKKISETHHLVHIHGNNNHICRKIYDKNMPDVFEATYINKQLINKYEYVDYKLHPLDMIIRKKIRDCNLDMII